jgi:hypothetical protein
MSVGDVLAHQQLRLRWNAKAADLVLFSMA